LGFLAIADPNRVQLRGPNFIFHVVAMFSEALDHRS